MYKGKNFYYLNQGHVINSFYSIREEMERVSYGYYMLEMVDKSLGDEQKSEKLFLLLQKGLEILSHLKEDFLKFIVGYEIKFVSFLGYRPVLDRCVSCEGKTSNKAKFSIKNGGLICPNCFSEDFTAINIDRNIYNTINDFLYTKLEDIGRIHITEKSLLKLHNILIKYILYNIDRKRFNSLNWIDCFKG
jgi:DNA repair protein RecO (recombination protein O)